MSDLQYYAVLEHNPGGPLKEHLRAVGKLSLELALKFFCQVADALREAHARGILHGDLRPEWVHLSGTREARLTGFGIAGLIHSTLGEDAAGLMRPPAGTVGWIAPELYARSPATPASDIYALGILLYQMLAGVPPHQSLRLSSDEEIIQLTTRGLLPSLADACPDVPEEIEKLYRYCTSVGVAHRYAEVSAFLPVARRWAGM